MDIFRVSQQHGDIHIRQNVFEQAAKRSLFLALFVAKAELDNVCNIDT